MYKIVKSRVRYIEQECFGREHLWHKKDEYVVVRAGKGHHIDEFVKICVKLSQGKCHLFNSSSICIEELIKKWQYECYDGEELTYYRLQYIIVNMDNVPEVPSSYWRELACFVGTIRTKVILYSEHLDTHTFPEHFRIHIRDDLTVLEWINREKRRSDAIAKTRRAA